MVGEPKVLFGRFRVSDEIARDEEKKVVPADDTEVKDEVILVLYRNLSSEQQVRVTRDAETLSSLTHPNITRVRALGNEDDDFFIALERDKGLSLNRLDPDSLSPARAAQIKQQIEDALRHGVEAGLTLEPVDAGHVTIDGERARVTLVVSSLMEPSAESGAGEAQVGAGLASALASLDAVAAQPSDEQISDEVDEASTVWPIPGRRYDPERLGRRVIAIILLIAVIAFGAFIWRITTRDVKVRPIPTPSVTISWELRGPARSPAQVQLGFSGVPSVTNPVHS